MAHGVVAVERCDECLVALASARKHHASTTVAHVVSTTLHEVPAGVGGAACCSIVTHNSWMQYFDSADLSPWLRVVADRLDDVYDGTAVKVSMLQSAVTLSLLDAAPCHCFVQVVPVFVIRVPPSTAGSRRLLLDRRHQAVAVLPYFGSNERGSREGTWQQPGLVVGILHSPGPAETTSKEAYQVRVCSCAWG